MIADFQENFVQVCVHIFNGVWYKHSIVLLTSLWLYSYYSPHLGQSVLFFKIFRLFSWLYCDMSLTVLVSVISKVVLVAFLQNDNQGHVTRVTLESNFLKMCEKVLLLFIFQQFLRSCDLTFLKNLPRFTKQLLRCMDFKIFKLGIWTWLDILKIGIFKCLWKILVDYFRETCKVMEPVAIKLDLTTGVFQIYYKTLLMVVAAL